MLWQRRKVLQCVNSIFLFKYLLLQDHVLCKLCHIHDSDCKRLLIIKTDTLFVYLVKLCFPIPINLSVISFAARMVTMIFNDIQKADWWLLSTRVFSRHLLIGKDYLLSSWWVITDRNLSKLFRLQLLWFQHIYMQIILLVSRSFICNIDAFTLFVWWDIIQFRGQYLLSRPVLEQDWVEAVLRVIYCCICILVIVRQNYHAIVNLVK